MAPCVIIKSYILAGNNVTGLILVSSVGGRLIPFMSECHIMNDVLSYFYVASMNRVVSPWTTSQFQIKLTY